MRGEWQEVRLTDLYDISSGLSKPAKDFGSGYPFLAFKDVFNNYFVPDDLTQLVRSSEKEQKKCSVIRGDVFLTRTSETMHELGMSSVALKDYDRATFNGFTKRLRPKDCNELVPEYIGYYLRSQKFRNEMLAFSTMSTRASLNNEMISHLRISFPSISEQEDIAWVLKSLDDKIQLNRRMNTTLEAMAQALFKSWFVDFDPVIDKALAAGNPIPEPLRKRAEARQALGDKRKPLPADVAQHFPDRFVFKEEVGWVPEGWQVMPFGNLIESTIGGDWGKDEKNEKYHKRVVIIRGTDIPSIHLGQKGAAPSRWIEGKKFESRQLIDGDLVLEVSGGSPKQPTGRSTYITDATRNQYGGAVVPASFCRKLRPKSKGLGLYAAMHLKRIYALGKMWGYQNQSTGISNFQTKTFLKVETVMLPSRDDLLQQFFNLVRPLVDKTRSHDSEALTHIRDTLLPKLLSGQLRIPDAEKLIGETAQPPR